jgi:hypothetical protein
MMMFQKKDEYEYTSDILSNIYNKSKEIENSVLNSLKPDEASVQIIEYHEALADIQISSNNLVNIDNILENETSPEEQDKKFS